MTPLLKPDGKVESSQKAIQTVLDNLAVKTRKHLKSMSEYSAQVSNKRPDMQPEIESAAKEIAKYEKISIDKMMEFSLKSMNAAAAETTAVLPSSARFKYADVQRGFTEKLMEEYLGITNGLADVVLGVLTASLDLPAKEKAAREAAKSLPKLGDEEKPNHAAVAICTSEEIVGKTIALKRDKINEANNNMFDKMNLFLEDMSNDIAGLTGSVGDIMNKLPDIKGSVAQAMNFENQKPNIFPFEIPPNAAASDFYTMAKGSGAQSDSKTPSIAAIGQIATNQLPDIKIPKKIPFAEPSKDQPMVDLVKNVVENRNKNSDIS